MKRKDRIYLLTVALGIPIVIIPLVIDLFFPALLQFILRLSCLFFIYLAFFLFFRNNPSIPFIDPIPSSSNIPPKPLSFLAWVGNILLIQFSAICLFLGQLFTVHQYETFKQHLPNAYAMQSWLENVRLFCQSQWLFPWSVVCVIMLIIFQIIQKHPRLSALSHVFKSGFSVVGRIPEVPLHVSTRLLVALSIGLAGLQLSLILYPHLSTLFTPLLGLTACFLLLLLTQARAFGSLLNQLEKRHYPPVVFFMIALCIITIVCIGFSVVATFAFSHSMQKLALFHSLHFYSDDLFPTLYGLFIFGWWLIAMPALSSLLLSVSHGKKIKHTIGVCFILPIALLIISRFFHTPTLMQAASFPIQILYTMQFIGYLGIALLFKNKISYGLLSSGYYPIKTPKKFRTLRVTDYQSLWAVIVAMLIVFSLSGIQGLQLLLATVGFVALILYFFLLLWSFKKPS